MENLKTRKVIFLDIETVPAYQNWEDVPENEQLLWEKKTKFQRKEDISAADYYPERAGILAEFAKVVCISCIYFNGEKFAMKSFYDTDEVNILWSFSDFLNECRKNGIYRLCAHNGKEFDFPFLARRFIIQGLVLPSTLQLSGKKPWEIPHFDTMEMWRFGDYKNYTSLELLAHVLGIPSPKSDIDGSQVAQVYYIDQDLERIKTYCENDTTTVYRIFEKLMGHY